MLKGHQGGVTDVWIGNGGNLCVSVSREERKSRIWDLAAADPSRYARVLNLPFVLSEVFVTQDGRWIVCGANNGQLAAWNRSSDDATQPRLLAAHDRRVHKIAATPNGRWLIAGSWDNTVRLWDRSREDPWESSIEVRGHNASVHDVATSQDGRRLLTDSADSTARLWAIGDEAPNKPVLALRGHEGIVWSVSMTPDDRWAITTSEDDTAKLWDRNIKSLYIRARKLAGRELTAEERAEYVGDGS